MSNWKLLFTKHAGRDAKRIAASGLREQAEYLLSIVAADPLQTPPAFEKLTGDLKGAYSRRINIQHRLVYEILDDLQTVRILRMWAHYE